MRARDRFVESRQVTTSRDRVRPECDSFLRVEGVVQPYVTVTAGPQGGPGFGATFVARAQQHVHAPNARAEQGDQLPPIRVGQTVSAHQGGEPCRGGAVVEASVGGEGDKAVRRVREVPEA